LAYIVPRRICACRKQEGTANWRKRCNEELHNMNSLYHQGNERKDERGRVGRNEKHSKLCRIT
jgi:hypothetical protein